VEQLFMEFDRTTWLPFEVIAVRLLLATLLGAAVGFEREWRRHPAGLRTHILVCLASATVAVVTVEITHSPLFTGDGIRSDPVRLVEAVTGGVAFLAAGLIVFTRGEIHGLTTGAGMWLAGAIGLTAGLGLWTVAVLATVLGLIVLSLLRLLENKLRMNTTNAILPGHPEDEGESQPQRHGRPNTPGRS